jgi:hypothetical protein
MPILATALQAFDYAYTQLARGGSPDDSLLARVIRLDTVLTDRPQPPPLPNYVDAAQPVRHCCQPACRALRCVPCSQRQATAAGPCIDFCINEECPL